MAHYEQMNFVLGLKYKFPKYFYNCSVLEIGSLNINGTIRIFFDECKYIGVDIGNGKCVDVVCEGQNLNYDDNFFDTVASCECFEHNPYWLETFLNMYRMTKNNGLLFFTCATTGRPEHGTIDNMKWASPLTQWNYYKNLTENDFYEKINFNILFSDFKFIVDKSFNDLYFYGIKR